MSKFASVTAGLLARKGEAQPWTQGAAQGTAQAPVQERMPLVWRSEGRSEIHAAPAFAEASAGKPPPPPPVKDRSCAVRMSPHDYERLGILAVKTGTTRQALLKQALAQFLAAKAEDYGCACLGACERNCGQAG